MTLAFQYHPDILARFPNLAGGVILARGLRGGPTPDDLKLAYEAEQQGVLARLAGRPLSELDSLAAWRSAFRAFNVEPTQYRCAAEALLRRLTKKKGDIPSINLLVDIGNLVSIRYALPVAIMDAGRMAGPVTVHFADGSERFKELGAAEEEHPEAGEVVFSDPTGRVFARRWCWRQSEDCAAAETTTNAIITVEAQHPGGRADVENALRDLLGLLREYAGGEYVSGVLDAEQPGIQSA
jgi:DNA/RNA-binding domain of Phe-tRNA-synthetase-like protein